MWRGREEGESDGKNGGKHIKPNGRIVKNK